MFIRIKDRVINVDRIASVHFDTGRRVLIRMENDSYEFQYYDEAADAVRKYFSDPTVVKDLLAEDVQRIEADASRMTGLTVLGVSAVASGSRTGEEIHIRLPEIGK